MMRDARRVAGLAGALLGTLALALAVPDGARAQNPLFTGAPQGSSDPSVGFFGGQFRVTSSRGRRVRNSTDLVNWREDHSLFARGGAPRWAVGGRVGSSKISRLSDGSYVLVFGALHRGNKGDRRFCIGRARARTPYGFKNQGLLRYKGRNGRKKPGAGPLFCAGRQSRPDYSVFDPDLFRDPANGRLYLLYKRQLQRLRGGRRGRSDIVIRPVGQDAKSQLGPITRLVQASGKRGGRDGVSVEAPTMVARNRRYFLFYSIANYANDSYAVSVAASRREANTPTGGNFTKFAGNPIYSGKTNKMNKPDTAFCGVGHQDIMPLPNDRWVIFAHAYLRETPPARPGGNARCKGKRQLVADELRWNIPSTNPQNTPEGFAWPSVGDGTPSGNGKPSGTLTKAPTNKRARSSR